jgi:pimeloyl-ACP methyl ester carboxylesterase
MPNIRPGIVERRHQLRPVTLHRATHYPHSLCGGGEIAVFPPSVVKRLASLNPTTVQWVKEIPDSGVLPHLEHPALVIALLKQWLDQVVVASVG